MQTVPRSERLDIRLTPIAKQLLVSAANNRHKSLSEFILETALNEAEHTLAQERSHRLSADSWDMFHSALDAPVRRHERMEKLLQEPSVFD